MMDLTHVRFTAAPRRSPPAPGPVASSHPQPLEVQDPAGIVEGLPRRVLRQTGLDPAAYRAAPLRRRVPACLRAMRASSEAEACARLEDEAVLNIALDSLLIGVSGFFRDAAVWTALQGRVLPDLARRRPGTIRVLSIACSSGAELYSVAMLLAEARLLHRSELVGVDCRPGALAAARAGLVDTVALETVAPELRDRYFERTGAAWRATGALRHRSTWQLMDATRVLPAGSWDLVLCRNFLMYLRDDIADAVCRRAIASLSPGGLLVLGKAERPPSCSGLTTVSRSIHRSDGA